MKKRSKKFEELRKRWAKTRQNLIGLGERSVRKSFYPELRKRMAELERFRALLEQSSEAIFLLEAPSGRIVDVNEGACSQCGVKREELVSLPISKVLDFPCEGFELTKRRTLLGTLQSRGGRRLPVEMAVSMVKLNGGSFFVIVARDVTEQKKAERALRESEERFRMLADNIAQLAWMADNTGRIYWCNKRWLDYTGMCFNDVKDFGWRNVHHPQHLERFFEKVQHSFKQGLPLEDTHPLRSKDGTYRWYLTRAIPVKDEDGTVLRYFGTCTDITELRQARKTAETVNRAKDEFLSILSHELRTPLTAMLGWVRILRAGKICDAAVMNRGLEVIERNTVAQNRLIDDLLDVSRAISGKIMLDRKPMNPVSIIDAVIEAHRPLADAKNLTIEESIEIPDAVIRADAQRLQQILANLMTNSIKFTPVGGKISVTLKKVGTKVAMVVSDTGIGIDPEFLPHVFDRFRQADASMARKFQGLGLGLAIVKHLIDLHGGTVEARSEGKNKGAAFIVKFPLAAVGRDIDGGALNTLKVPEPVKASLRGVRVLLIEDDFDSREVLTTILAAQGAVVKPVVDVPSALTAFDEFKPQLVVSDIGLPGEDGYSFVRKLRKLPPQEGGRVPAIALTAFARYEDRVRALSEGFHVFLAKPVDPDKLLDVVGKVASNRTT